MREILFRGKRVDNGEWAYGDIAHIEDRVFVSYYNNCELKQFINDLVTSNNITLVGVFPFVEVIPETVGQYTGLKDENGKKIFENGYMIIDNKTYKVIFDNAEYILTNIFNCDIITLKNNSIKGVFVDEI